MVSARLSLILLTTLFFITQLSAKDNPANNQSDKDTYVHKKPPPAKSLQPSQFKSALTYNLLRHIKWPKQNQFKKYLIGYVGAESQLFNELKSAARTIKVNNKPVNVRQLSLIEIRHKNFNPHQYQLLYIGLSDAGEVPEITSITRRTLTLIVTEQSSDKRDLMINIYPDRNKIKFEVNSSNIIYEGLTLHKDILLLGGTQMDVAKLLRSSESELQSALNSLYSTKKSLTTQSKQLNENRKKAKRLVLRISEQKLRLEKLQSSLLQKIAQMTTLNIKLGEINDKSENVNRILEINKKQLNRSQNTLQKNKLIINKLNKDIISNSRILLTQERDINKQKNKLVKKEQELSYKHSLLLTSYAIMLLFILMTIIIWRMNIIKKKALVELSYSNKSIKAIASLGMDITANLNFEEMTKTLYRHIQNLLESNIFAIAIYNPENRSLEYLSSFHNGQQYQGYSHNINSSDHLSVRCFKTNESIRINCSNPDNNNEEISNSNTTGFIDGDFSENKPPLRPLSMMFTPILSGSMAIGVISIQSEKANAYSPRDSDLLTTLAAYTSVAYNNYLAHEKIKKAQQNLIMQEKMASLGFLTAGVAHEINNPTNFTQLSAQNLKLDLSDFKQSLFQLAGKGAEPGVIQFFTDNFASLNKKIETILDGTERIKNTVKDLRNFTRQDSEEKCNVKLSENITSTLQLIKSKYGGNIHFICQFIDEPEFDCWPAQLNQVFMNLIVNACDAINVKRLKTERYQGEVIVKMSLKDKCILIQFVDNGCGMSRKQQQRAFEIFYTTKAIGDGTGLGLSISYDIIKKHGGKIMLESIEGQGSTLTISLPYLYPNSLKMQDSRSLGI